MMEDPKRGPNRIEKTMGLLWDVIDDTITALPRYNLHSSSRGKATGPDLVDMEIEEIMNMCITRMTFLRVVQQLSKGRLSKETVVQGTFVQWDSSPRRH